MNISLQKVIVINNQHENRSDKVANENKIQTLLN